MKKKGIRIEEILKLYNDNISVQEISEKLNCTPSNITRRLRKLGLVAKNIPKRFKRTGRYKLNEQYFDEINTNEKAYILGLLYSDGSVSEFGFYIKIKDEDVLIKVKEELQAEQPIKFYRRGSYESYVFSVYSLKIRKALIKLGCTPNKTYTLEFPEIEEKFYSHFLRGFYDGDGSLNINNNATQCRFDLTCASPNFLKSCQNILSKLVCTRGSLIKESGISNAWHLRYSGFRVNLILDWLYNNSTIFIKRKHDKFLIYKNVHLKQGELLENPEVGNQQPSLDSNILEGSTTNSQVLTDNAEDSNANTSALLLLENYASKMKVETSWSTNR